MSLTSFTGADGKEWFEFGGQVVVVPSGTMSNADGVVMMAAPNTAPYTLDTLSVLRNAQWDRRRPEPLTDNSRWTLMGSTGPVTDSRFSMYYAGEEPENPTGRFQNLDWDEAS